MKTRLELIKEATAKYLRQKKHFDKKAAEHEKNRNIWQSASGDTPILHRTSEVNYHSSAADKARKEAAIRQAKIDARKKISLPLLLQRFQK